MKKLLLFFIFILSFLFTQTAFAEDVFKITGANFDVSNSLFVLNAQDETEMPILSSVKLVKLDNPRRAYFDIPSSVLIIPKQDWNFSTKGIKEVKIGQFSTNPNVVRVVMYFDDDFDVSALKFKRIKNNIIIELKSSQIDDDYFYNTYRDEHSSASDYYEYLTVEVPDNLPKESLTEQIQQAFSNVTQQTPKMDSNKFIKKELKLNSHYYINQVTPRQNAILLSGFGSLTIEKPLILTNPSRIVYDIPNTVVKSDLRNSQFALNEKDSVKVGQFEVNKARVVITTEDTDKYVPIYSTDNQSVLIANIDKTNHLSLFKTSSDIIAYNTEKIDNQTASMILSFNHPIVHAIDRLDDKLIVYLYNVSKYNEDGFEQEYKNTIFSKGKITLLPNIGMKLVIPTEKDTLVNTYLGADGKTLKIKMKVPKTVYKPQPVTIPRSNTSGKYTIVLDPGHGGEDCGAIRNGIDEKSIVLDVSKRVRDILVKKGYNVYMTREEDKTVSLQDRVEFSEAVQPDIFLSIHVNSSEKSAITGIETHYYRQESLSLAQTVHASMISNIKTNNRGLFKSKFYVINHTTAPAILVEIGFLSNAGERAELVTEKRKQTTAKAIVEGVENYFK